MMRQMLLYWNLIDFDVNAADDVDDDAVDYYYYYDDENDAAAAVDYDDDDDFVDYVRVDDYELYYLDCYY